MGLVETIPNTTEIPFKNLEISPIRRIDWREINNNPFDVSLNYVSEGCKKSEKKKIFKEIYQNLMDQNPNATYQEKLDLANKYITDLQEQNPDVHPDVFKAMKRSFAAKTGYEITKLRKELKNSEKVVILDNGKEFHYSHPWKNVIENLTENVNNKRETEKISLIKIIDFRTRLKKSISLNNSADPTEMLKICENYFAESLKNNPLLKVKSFLNEDSINQTLNPERKYSSPYASHAVSNFEVLTFDSWVSKTIKRNENLYSEK